MRRWPGALTLLLVTLVLWGPVPVAAELRLPPGFTAQVYVTGEGFGGGAVGIPSTSTLAFDRTGVLYLARTGRRYTGGEVEELWPVYRIAVGGARLTPSNEARYLYGPPLPNAQITATHGGGEVLVTTFDRERKVGVLYRIRDGYAELVAGGTPPPGAARLFAQPEGVAADAAGNLYVADRDQGVVVKLDATGRVLDPRWASVRRPRLLAVDDRDHVWIGSDGDAEAPWQRGPGEIWKVGPTGGPVLVLRGGVPAGMALGPGGHLFVADRHAAKIFFLTPDGAPAEFIGFTEGDVPRSLGFAPITDATRRAGIAGDLFVVTIRVGTFRLNEIVRISGPFDRLVGAGGPDAR